MEDESMIRRVVLSVVLMVGCLWCLALAGRADGNQSAVVGPFKPVAEVESIMHGQNIFFKEITEQLEKPAGEKRNKELFESAQVLAELANVNRFNKDKDDYRNWATQLRDTALEFAAGARMNDRAGEDRMKPLYNRMKGICQSCHDAYQ
jgi:cytochrome c556